MIHRINVFLLSVIIAFAPTYVFASLVDPTDQWIMESMTENKDSLGRTTTAHLNARKVEIVNGSFREVSAAIDYKPPPGAAGRVMGKRLAQAAVGGGVAIIGAALVDGLLKGIGWIMEDGGKYYKNKQPEGNIVYFAGYSGSDPASYPHFSLTTAVQAEVDHIKGINPPTYEYRLLQTNINKSVPNLTYVGQLARNRQCVGCYESRYDRGGVQGFTAWAPADTVFSAKKVSDQTGKVYLTPSELEDIMYGNYSGDADAGISPKNDGVWTGVKESMTPDPNAGEGTKDKPSNEISKDIENKLDASPNKTTKDTGTESKSNGENTKKNADGTEEKTQTETTQKMPAFCQYAAAFCVWMDWTQTEDLPEKDTTDFDDESPVVQKDVDVNFGSECPAPASVSYTVKGRTESIQVVNFEYVCAQAPIIKPSIIALASIGAAFIVFGRGREQ